MSILIIKFILYTYLFQVIITAIRLHQIEKKSFFEYLPISSFGILQQTVRNCHATFNLIHVRMKSREDEQFHNVQKVGWTSNNLAWLKKFHRRRMAFREETRERSKFNAPIQLLKMIKFKIPHRRTCHPCQWTSLSYSKYRDTRSRG